MADWLQTPGAEGKIVDSLAQFNASLQATNPVDEARILFDGLLSVVAAFVLGEARVPEDDTTEIARLLKRGLDENNLQLLLREKSVLRLARLQPPVLNHQELRTDPRYRPGREIPDDLYEKAATEHRDFSEAFESWLRSSEGEGRLRQALARLLYTIRSNIAHGEKTAFGPDVGRVKRDRAVCEATIPVLRNLFDAAFDHPECRLATYGTLAPGQANHSIVEDLPGQWLPAHVTGTVKLLNGLPYLDWQVPGDRVDLWVLQSEELIHRWGQLDNFESGYRRILVWATSVDRPRSLVCNVYAAEERGG